MAKPRLLWCMTRARLGILPLLRALLKRLQTVRQLLKRDLNFRGQISYQVPYDLHKSYVHLLLLLSKNRDSLHRNNKNIVRLWTSGFFP